VLTFLRHLLAVVALPVTVAILVPRWIAGRYAVTFSAPSDLAGLLALSVGCLFLAVGLALFAASLYNFVTHGRGTLAPWDPPRHLVVRGPYRFVRNPMISGVIFVLASEALVLRSLPHAAWAAAFLALNAVYIPLVEEPQLEARFGEPYARYCRHVSRFVPRLRPWTPDRA
jgi:protein-S-isoprenylcysteine O-methyltransferase Ste14